MYKFMIANSDHEYDIYVNLISSSAGHYLSRYPHVIGLIEELLATQELTGSRIVIERDMGRSIGTTDVVSTSTSDTVYYAQPLKSEVFSRFAKNRYPQQSKMLTVIVERDADGDYEVRDTWVGSYHPAFPGDKNETSSSKEYWQNHAFVHDSQIIQSKSITKVCPY